MSSTGKTSICLKVRWESKSYKLLSFDINLTCEQVIDDIITRFELSNDENYHLYSPPSETRGPIWLDHDKTLNDYELYERVCVIII